MKIINIGIIIVVGIVLMSCAKGKEKQSIEFAEWIRLNEFRLVYHMGVSEFKYPEWYQDSLFEDSFTSKQLYDLFIRSNGLVPFKQSNGFLIIDNGKND